MPETLGGLYSFGNRAKRQLRDLLSNPTAYLEQSAEKLRDEAGRPTSARQVAERTFNPSEADIERASAWWNPSPLGAMAGVIKQKGGNWLAGSVEDALNHLLPRMAGPGGLRVTLGDIANPQYLTDAGRAEMERIRPVNDWIEGPLTKYVKTRMASPEDEVRKLAEQGVLHDLSVGEMFGRNFVHPSGEHYDKLAKNPLAQGWENASDNMLRVEPASTYQNFGSSNLGEEWVNKLDPKTPFYRFKDTTVPTNLGFPHLIDELSNALDPNSGLPRHLQLTPEAMQNLSMEKAVRRVHDINEWRAAQQAELNKQRATSKVAPVVREYAENNPKGLHWREIGTTDEGYLKDYFGTEDAYRKALEDQLKYEGDVMQNCVGGYCEDVLSGRSRIFSLRDAKGEPHVTVEVGSPPPGPSDVYDDYRAVTGKTLNPRSDEYQEILMDFMDTPEYAAYQKSKKPPSPSIVQIKGKGNRAPNEEYLLFVQDFVRNSPLGSAWSDVGDLANTGLISARDQDAMVRAALIGKPIGINEGYAAAKRLGERQPYYTQDELLEAFKEEFPDKFASGGRVAPITIRPGTETATTGTRGRAEWVMFQE